MTLFAAVALLEDEAGTALDALKASEPAAASVRVWDRVCRRGIAGGGSVTIGVACEGMGSRGRRFVVVVVSATVAVADAAAMALGLAPTDEGVRESVADRTGAGPSAFGNGREAGAGVGGDGSLLGSGRNGSAARATAGASGGRAVRESVSLIWDVASAAERGSSRVS